MRYKGILIPIALLGFVLACASKTKMTVTQSPGVDQIPSSIAVYPLLTTQPIIQGRPVDRRSIRSLSVDSREGEMFIEAPAESKLIVNIESQLLTGLLSADLAYYGFSLKELPVEIPDTESKKVTFAVSLDLLRRMNEDYGVDAVLIGNVYFSRDRYEPSKHFVKAAYFKLVDVETLDILCHLSLYYDYEGLDLESAAQAIAAELAAMAGLDSEEVSLAPEH